MEYFESDVPSGDGLCSDNACPCPEVVIPRGTGHLYIEQSIVDFRRQYPTLESARRAMKEKQKQASANLGVAVGGFYRLGAILVCDQGAKRRNLDMEVAAADAKKWWEDGMVPLRKTPMKSAESQIINKSTGSGKTKACETKAKISNGKKQLTKSMTDAIRDNMENYKPELDLNMSCPKCGKKPLPEKMMGHLFAVGCSTIDCQHCNAEIPLVTDMDIPCSLFSTNPLDELDLESKDLVELGKDISLSKNLTSELLSDVECHDTYPSIRFADNFYDGTDRKQKFPTKMINFADHLDVICNLKALKIAVEKGDSLASEKTFQCFNRLATLLLLSQLNPIEAEAYKIPSKIVNEWEGLLWTVAYLRISLSQANQILSKSTKTEFSQEELKQTLIAKSQIPTTNIDAICALDVRRKILEMTEYFFSARFLTVLKERRLTKGGYEAYKIAECIKNAFQTMGINDVMMGKCMNINVVQNDSVGNDNILKNAALIHLHYRKVEVDMKDFRVFGIGKLSPNSPSLIDWLKNIFS
ncbi:MAG: hypothetical protein KAI43_01945 [Candidatus Aureabacteria bacterium]|nr:hypothetical protein [Candidatus Auribacterota bacterium]